MQYIIKDYRKLLKKVDQFERYTVGLEEENVSLKKKLDELTPEREKILEEKIKRLTEQNENYKRSQKNYEKNILERFPERKEKIQKFREIVNGQKLYIADLQKLLDQHGIRYYTIDFDYNFEVRVNATKIVEKEK